MPHWNGMCESEEFNGPKCNVQCRRCKPRTADKPSVTFTRPTRSGKETQVHFPITRGQNSFGEPGWFITCEKSRWHGYPLDIVCNHYEAERFKTDINYGKKNTKSATGTRGLERTGKRKIRIPGL